MLPLTIHASVAPETISKVGRLFNGSLEDILTELLQNSRRAGATSIAITADLTADDPILTIADDGHGITDPSSILTLGRSDWSDDTRRREDPAGMGVFSLAGRAVTVRSFSNTAGAGWRADIPADGWDSGQPITVLTDPIACGTEISLAVPKHWHLQLAQAVARVARYYPLPVSWNGREVEQQEWLANAVHVEEWNGSRIGVMREMPSHYRSVDPRLNFHGLIIGAAMPIVTEVDRGRHWTVRVDILDTPDLQLVLPARKEVVQNDALTALRAAAHAAIFRAITALGSHRLSHADWCVAQGMGIELPEADAYLEGWRPAIADGDSYEGGARITGLAMTVMPELDAIIAQPVARCLTRHNPVDAPLVHPEARFAGYHWYDTLAHVEDVTFRVTLGGQVATIDIGGDADTRLDSGFVDAIELVMALSHAGASVTTVTATDVAFASDCWGGNELDEVGLFVVRGCDANPSDVLDLFERAIFSANTDSDCDSPSTQSSAFRAEAAERITTLMVGADAAIEQRLRALMLECRWFIPKGRAVTIRLDATEVAVSLSPVELAAA
ncbi:ATP-binding protein [Sphingomonas sp. Leaf4]|uniref:ATP-binding protein n=1 Tax=Sphingomonas sp. Leaf4 TaxID=2876553 RepID=UPI001E5EA08C|nr:ATP-binding protein [Sphingomonas sp. Leaf4]